VTLLPWLKHLFEGGGILARRMMQGLFFPILKNLFEEGDCGEKGAISRCLLLGYFRNSRHGYGD
jgi:hypothetical protein